MSPSQFSETFVFADRRIDNGNLLAVDLLGSDERHVRDAVFGPDFPMNPVEPRERLRFIVRHLDARHA